MRFFQQSTKLKQESKICYAENMIFAPKNT